MLSGTSSFRLLGLEASPYTMKVKSFLIYKGLPFEWITRSIANEPLFKKHAKVQLIPLLFFPGGETMQDSTLIIERIESEGIGTSIHPQDKTLWFLSCLFEEFGDEWCNKLMFFQRWFYKDDAKATGSRLAHDRLEGKWYRPIAKPLVARLLVRRMVPRLAYSGGNSTNIPQLKQSFEDLVAMLDVHLRTRPYLLGGRPSFGDFGLWCNLYEAWTDPTAKSYIEAHGQNLTRYIRRMQAPTADGPFESLETLRPTLKPILRREMGTRFLPWMQANHEAFHAGQAQTHLTMNGQIFQQRTFKYQANTLDELRRKFRSVATEPHLVELLAETNCLEFLQPVPDRA